MSNHTINSLITQNRLLSQAKSRARSQSTGIGKALQSGSSNKDNILNSIKNQAAGKSSGLSKSDAKSKENYTAMKVAAESLKKHTDKLLSMPDMDWEKLTEEESAKYKSDAISEVTAMIDDYNKMMKSMADEGGTVNEIYSSQMKGYFQNAKAGLEELGITENKDGTLAVNKERLNAADAKKLKEIFGSKGTFVDDIGKRAQNVISNAETNLAVINKSMYAGSYSYDQNGNDIFEMLASGAKYNTKG